MRQHPHLAPVRSRQDQLRHLRSLVERRAARRIARELVVEGPHALEEALDAGAAVITVFVAPSEPDTPRTEDVQALVGRAAAAGADIVEVARRDLERAADAVSPQPVLAVVASPEIDLPTAVGAVGGFALVAVDVRDPGNVGTLVRSAEAAGADAVILCDGCADATSPKVVRASAGAIFHVPLCIDAGPAVDVLAALRTAGVRVVGTSADRPGAVLWTIFPSTDPPSSSSRTRPTGSTRTLPRPTPWTCGSPSRWRVGPNRSTWRWPRPCSSSRRRAADGPIVRPEEAAGAGASAGRRAPDEPPAHAPRQESAPVQLDDLPTLVRDGHARIAAATTLDALRAVEIEVLGRQAPLTELNKGLGALPAEDRKTAGAAINAARAELTDAAAARRAELAVEERRRRLEAERMDLTERVRPDEPGRTHLITRTIEDLEDIFVGMGFSVWEGPEAETDWYNFEALNFPPGHPARTMHDTFHVELGEPGEVVLRTHTSPMQIRVMQAMAPPIYAVMPGRCYRRDTPDARHLHTFHQIEALVIDKGISLGHLAGTIEVFIPRLLRQRQAEHPPASGVLPLHRAVGGVRHHVPVLHRLRVPRLLAHGLDRARRLRHGPSQRAARRWRRPRGVDRLRLGLRHRPPRHEPPRPGRPARPPHQRRPAAPPVLTVRCHVLRPLTSRPHRPATH